VGSGEKAEQEKGSRGGRRSGQSVTDSHSQCIRCWRASLGERAEQYSYCSVVVRCEMGSSPLNASPSLVLSFVPGLHCPRPKFGEIGPSEPSRAFLDWAIFDCTSSVPRKQFCWNQAAAFCTVTAITAAIFDPNLYSLAFAVYAASLYGTRIGSLRCIGRGARRASMQKPSQNHEERNRRMRGPVSTSDTSYDILWFT
jgi:hypothetical protein